jgi:hypothetical protein
MNEKTTGSSIKRVQVCEKCLTASCWYGESMCQEAKNEDVVMMEVKVLMGLGREHPENWGIKKITQIYGEIPKEFLEP